jgi:hypothetical protein
MPTKKLLLPLCVLACALGLGTHAEGPSGPPSSSTRALGIGRLPSIGPWVCGRDGKPASWLGKRYRGRILLEPINIVIVDGLSKSEDGSIREIEKLCADAGYKKRFGHSYGYLGKIGDRLLGQLPKEYRTAFAAAPAWETGNHCRLFGPMAWNGHYIYIGSASRESFALFALVHHDFVSYDQARDDFVDRSTGGGPCQRLVDLRLGNVRNDDAYTTGDHDGNAAVLLLGR